MTGRPDTVEVPERTAFRRRLKRTFTALKYRNYRLWFAGQTVSLFGTWMQTTALTRVNR